MYENFLESHTLFISAKVVDSPCHSQKEKSISLRINIEQVLNKRIVQYYAVPQQTRIWGHQRPAWMERDSLYFSNLSTTAAENLQKLGRRDGNMFGSNKQKTNLVISDCSPWFCDFCLQKTENKRKTRWKLSLQGVGLLSCVLGLGLASVSRGNRTRL